MSKETPSIVLIIPYFGCWPRWFPLFLETCAFNADVNWLFYTDCELPEDAPSNVAFKRVSFKSYKDLVSRRLGINFQPENPYKLCDIKPVLGFVHEQDIRGYDFWGFSDIDLVYGDLRAYFTNQRLAKYDLLSTHSRRVSGHFCLIRNTEKMRNAFRRIKNWKTRMADNQHYALDEGAFSKIFIRHKNLPKPLFELLSKLNPWRRKSEFVEAYSTPNAGVAWLDGSYNFPNEWCWNSGKLTNDITGAREYPYFHFFGWKKDLWNGGELYSDIGPLKQSSFKINEKGFFRG